MHNVANKLQFSLAIIYSFPSSQRILWIHYFPLDANVGQFLSLLVAFKNTKTSRHSEIKQTRPSTKQDFSGEALSKPHFHATRPAPGADRVVRIGVSHRLPGRARRDPGLGWSWATLTIENIREGSSAIRQFVALSFVALRPLFPACNV